MKMIKVLLVALFVMGIAGMAQARDLGEVGETVIDTLSGDNLDCPMLTSFYVAKTFKDAVNLPVVGKCDFRTKLSYTSSIRQINTNNSVMWENGLEF